VAGDEPRLSNEIGRTDRFLRETEVGDRDGARFLRVVDEVALRLLAVSSPMILIEFLFALTVPSAPRP